MVRMIAAVILFLAVVSLVLGIVFIVGGVDKNNWIKEAIAESIVEGSAPDSVAYVQSVADDMREQSRLKLLALGRLDPTDPNLLRYVPAMVQENYLYLAFLGFSLTEVVIASGVFMIIVAIALGGTGLALLALARGIPQVG